MWNYQFWGLLIPKHWGESLSLCMFKLWSLSLALTLLTSCEPESSAKTFYLNLVVHYFCSNLHETCILGQNKCTRNPFKLAGYPCFVTDNNTVNITYQIKIIKLTTPRKYRPKSVTNFPISRFPDKSTKHVQNCCKGGF